MRIGARLVVPLASGVAGFLYFAWVRDYPFRLALMMGAALIFLGFAVVRTWEQVRQMPQSGVEAAPGEDRQGPEQGQMDGASEGPSDKQAEQPGGE